MQFQRTLLAAILTAGVCSTAARATGWPFPHTHETPTSNGKYVFVMITPMTAPWQKVEDVRALRAKYPRSGLYWNDGSGKPVWTVGWYTYHVIPASDGIHLIDTGWNMHRSVPYSQATAVAFYAEGRLIRSYSVSDLVDVPKWLYSEGSDFVSWSRNGEFDESRMQYSLDTVDGNHFVFDVRTGEILSSSRPVRWVVRGAVLVVTLVGIVFAWVRWRTRPKVAPPA
jgi:hypothetical protein